MYYQQFLEVYYGEKDNIKEMQKCITNFRKDLLRNPLMGELNTHPEIRRFDRLAEKEFGFKAFQLYIDPDLVMNAYTMPIWYTPGTLFTKNNTMANVIISDKGYKFKKEANYVAMVCVYKGVFLNKDITDREIMGCILHEIGHNFQAAISQTQATMATGSYILAVVDCILDVLNIRSLHDMYIAFIVNPISLLGAYNKISAAIDEYMYQNFKGIYHFRDIVIGLLDVLNYPINKVFKYIYYLLSAPSLPIRILIHLNPANLLVKWIKGNYRGEKLADNFATIYGYGPDGASLEEKFMGDEVLNKVKIPIISPILGFVEATYMLLYSIPDEHPQAVTRIKDQRDYLEKEIKYGSYDPKFKKEILNQIDVIDKQLERITSFSYDGAISDYRYFERMYQCILYRLFGGDIKELGLLNPDDIHSDLEDVKKRKMNETGDIFIDMLNKLTFK